MFQERPSGSDEPLYAEIVNRGSVGSRVRVEYYVGQPAGQPIEQETVYLPAGQRHSIAQPLTVEPGLESYCILATPVDAEGTPVAEAHTADDNLSCTSLTGLADVSVETITLSNDQPVAGETILVSVRVRNNSDQALNQVNVSLFQGDPGVPAWPSQLADNETISTLAAFAATTIHFPWTVPDSTDADYLLTGGKRIRPRPGTFCHDGNR